MQPILWVRRAAACHCSSCWRWQLEHTSAQKIFMFDSRQSHVQGTGRATHLPRTLAGAFSSSRRMISVRYCLWCARCMGAGRTRRSPAAPPPPWRPAARRHMPSRTRARPAQRISAPGEEPPCTCRLTLCHTLCSPINSGLRQWLPGRNSASRAALALHAWDVLVRPSHCGMQPPAELLLWTDAALRQDLSGSFDC